MQYEELDIPRQGARIASAPAYRSRIRQADGSRRMMVLAGGIGAVALVAIVGWSMVGRGHGPVPVIQADSRPIRVKPDVRGGMQVTGANEDILSGAGGAQTDALAAPAEVPQTEQLHRMQVAEAERAAAASKPVVAPPPVAEPTVTPAKPVARAADAAPPVVQAVPAPVAKPAEAGHAAAARNTEVQLAAVGSEEAAKLEWRRLSGKMPDLLAGRKPDLSRIERDGRIFWRVRVAGFPDTAAASSFCDKVRGKGAGCSVAAF